MFETFLFSMHPESGNLFVTSTEDGEIKLFDRRAQTDEGEGVSFFSKFRNSIQ